jgi:chromosome segregation ATPase
MNVVAKKKAEFGSRFKSMIRRRSKPDGTVFSDDSEPVRSASMPEPGFQFASTTLDPTVQARENLVNFKAFLESDPSDPFADLLGVSQSFSGALATLRLRTDDFQAKLTEAQAASIDLDDQESTYEAHKMQFAIRLADLRDEKAALLRVAEQLRQEGERLEGQIAAGKAMKKSVRQNNDALTSYCTRLGDLEKQLIEECAHTVFLQQEVDRLKLEIEGQGQHFELELASSQARVRDLTLEAKRGELEEKRAKMQAKKKKLLPLLLTPDVSAFVIEDKVKISDEDTGTLRFMIGALTEENKEMIQERDDAMMDVDCLMQENIGLKLLIRQLSEGA